MKELFLDRQPYPDKGEEVVNERIKQIPFLRLERRKSRNMIANKKNETPIIDTLGSQKMNTQTSNFEFETAKAAQISNTIQDLNSKPLEIIQDPQEGIDMNNEVIENYIRDLTTHQTVTMTNKEFHGSIRNFIGQRWPVLQKSDMVDLTNPQAINFKKAMRSRTEGNEHHGHGHHVHGHSHGDGQGHLCNQYVERPKLIQTDANSKQIIQNDIPPMKFMQVSQNKDARKAMIQIRYSNQINRLTKLKYKLQKNPYSKQIRDEFKLCKGQVGQIEEKLGLEPSEDPIATYNNMLSAQAQEKKAEQELEKVQESIQEVSKDQEFESMQEASFSMIAKVKVGKANFLKFDNTRNKDKKFAKTSGHSFVVSPRSKDSKVQHVVHQGNKSVFEDTPSKINKSVFEDTLNQNSRKIITDEKQSFNVNIEQIMEDSLNQNPDISNNNSFEIQKKLISMNSSLDKNLQVPQGSQPVSQLLKSNYCSSQQQNINKYDQGNNTIKKIQAQIKEDPLQKMLKKVSKSQNENYRGRMGQIMSKRQNLVFEADSQSKKMINDIHKDIMIKEKREADAIALEIKIKKHKDHGCTLSSYHTQNVILRPQWQKRRNRSIVAFNKHSQSPSKLEIRSGVHSDSLAVTSTQQRHKSALRSRNISSHGTKLLPCPVQTAPTLTELRQLKEDRDQDEYRHIPKPSNTLNTNNDIKREIQEQFIEKIVETRFKRQQDNEGHLKQLKTKLQIEISVKKSLRQKGILLEGIRIPNDGNDVIYDEFGKRVDYETVALKAQMIRPRDIIHQREGILSIAEQRVFDRLNDMGQHHSSSGDLEIDSIMESAFNTEANQEWAEYMDSVRVPHASLISQEDVVLCAAEEIDDVSQGLDQFSDFNESGSSFSSQYSIMQEPQVESHKLFLALRKKENKHSIDLSIFNGDVHGKHIDKYRYFVVKEGVKLPTLQGYENKRFSIEDIIDISSYMIRQKKLKKKFSASMIQHIVETYQQEFKSVPIDIMKGLQLSGYLIFNHYYFSTPQLHTIAATIPYILNLRRIYLEGCNIKDEEAALIFRACRFLPKISEIHLGKNQLGPKFANQIKDCMFIKDKIKNISLSFLKNSSNHLGEIIQQIGKVFVNLKELDISGNNLSHDAAKCVSQIVASHNCKLEVLNLSNCLNSTIIAKVVMTGLLKNENIRFLNLSCNKLSDFEWEISSKIGRILKKHKLLVHLDISNCRLTQPELLFIVICLKDNFSLTSLHLGLNNIDYYGRLILRHVLNAKVKHPFRSTKLQVSSHKVNSAQDKQMLLILNSYIMSSLPPIEDQQNDKAGGITSLKKPLRNMIDVRRKVQDYRDYNASKNNKKKDISPIQSALQSDNTSVEDVMEQNTQFSEIEIRGLLQQAIGLQKEYQTECSPGINLNPLRRRTSEVLDEKTTRIREGDGCIFIVPENSDHRKVHKKLASSLYKRVKDLKQEQKSSSQSPYDSLTNIASQYLKNEDDQAQKFLQRQIKDGNNMLQKYFGSESNRAYDMLNFLDFYGRKNNMLKLPDFKKSEAQIKEEIVAMNESSVDTERKEQIGKFVIFGEGKDQLLIKTQQTLKNEGYILYQNNRETQNQSPLQRQASLSNEDLFFDQITNISSDKQQKELFRYIISAHSISDSDSIKKLKSIISQASQFTDLDQVVQEHLDYYNPMKDLGHSDIIFQRILGHYDVEDSDLWVDTNQCWKCQNHTKITFEINELQIIKDQDFSDLMQLSNFLNQDKIIKQKQEKAMMLQEKLGLADKKSGDKSVLLQKNLMPVLEDMFEGIPDSPHGHHHGHEHGHEDHAQEEDHGHGHGHGHGHLDDDSSDIGEDMFEPSHSEQNHGGGHCHSHVQPKLFNFDKYIHGQNIVPMLSWQNGESKRTYLNNEIKNALSQNRFLYHSNIAAKPISIRDLQLGIGNANQFFTPTAGLNQFNTVQASEFSFLYNDLKMQTDLNDLDLSDSDGFDEGAHGHGCCGTDKKKKDKPNFLQLVMSQLEKEKTDTNDSQSQSEISIVNQDEEAQIMKKSVSQKPGLQKRAISVQKNRMNVSRGSVKPKPVERAQTAQKGRVKQQSQKNSSKVDIILSSPVKMNKNSTVLINSSTQDDTTFKVQSGINDSSTLSIPGISKVDNSSIEKLENSSINVGAKTIKTIVSSSRRSSVTSRRSRNSIRSASNVKSSRSNQTQILSNQTQILSNDSQVPNKRPVIKAIAKKISTRIDEIKNLKEIKGLVAKSAKIFKDEKQKALKDAKYADIEKYQKIPDFKKRFERPNLVMKAHAEAVQDNWYKLKQNETDGHGHGHGKKSTQSSPSMKLGGGKPTKQLDGTPVSKKTGHGHSHGHGHGHGHKDKGKSQQEFILMASFNHWFPIKMKNQQEFQAQIQNQEQRFLKSLPSKEATRRSSFITSFNSTPKMTLHKIQTDKFKKGSPKKGQPFSPTEVSNNLKRQKLVVKFNKNQIQRKKQIDITQSQRSNDSQQDIRSIIEGTGSAESSQNSKKLLLKSPQISAKNLHKHSSESLKKILSKRTTTYATKVGQNNLNFDFKDHKYCEFIPSGIHYFYFIQDGNKFCLSNQFEVVLLPGSNIRMNTIKIEESVHDFNQYLLVPSGEEWSTKANIQFRGDYIALPTIQDIKLGEKEESSPFQNNAAGIESIMKNKGKPRLLQIPVEDKLMEIDIPQTTPGIKESHCSSHRSFDKSDKQSSGSEEKCSGHGSHSSNGIALTSLSSASKCDGSKHSSMSSKSSCAGSAKGNIQTINLNLQSGNVSAKYIRESPRISQRQQQNMGKKISQFNEPSKSSKGILSGRKSSESEISKQSSSSDPQAAMTISKQSSKEGDVQFQFLQVGRNKNQEKVSKEISIGIEYVTEFSNFSLSKNSTKEQLRNQNKGSDSPMLK